MKRLVYLLVLLAMPSLCWADEVADITQRVRQAAIDKWFPDATLVEIQVAGMLNNNQFENGSVGYFFKSAKSTGLLDVRTELNMTPQGQAYIQQHQPDYAQMLGKLQWSEEPQSAGFPYSLPIPENIIDVTRAVSMVRHGQVVSAEIHTYRLRSGGTVPVWNIESTAGNPPVLIDALRGTILQCQPVREPNGFKIYLAC